MVENLKKKNLKTHPRGGPPQKISPFFITINYEHKIIYGYGNGYGNG
jgi:hypothetical protein